jgi:hypothetical protein
MTLDKLEDWLASMRIWVVPTDDGTLELDMPEAVELPDPVLAALREHKAALMERPTDFSWRNSVDCWPIAWQSYWAGLAMGYQANGYTLGGAEWRAFVEVVRELEAAEARGEYIKYTFPPGRLRETNEEIMSALNRIIWDGRSLVDMIEEARQHNAAARERGSRRGRARNETAIQKSSDLLQKAHP